MSTSRHRDCPFTEQAVGWALHALEPDEESEVLTHLPRCAACQAAVQDAERVLAGMGASIEQVDPPESLRKRLLDRVAETPQTPLMLRPRSSPEAATTAPDAMTEATPVVAPASRRPEADSTQPGSGRWPSWLSGRGRRLVAASLALVGVLTVGGLAVRTTQLTEQRDAQIAQSQALADILTQLDEPGSAHATLAVSAGAPPIAAVVVHDGQRTLVTAGLAPNMRERDTYVVWGISDDGPRAIATFDVVGTGADVRPVGSASEADGFSAYAISLEPGRAAPASPSMVVASGQVET